MIEFGHGTHVGLRRDHNEDTYWADDALGLWLVADGMGGHEHGEVASAVARDTLVHEVGAGRNLEEAIRKADEAIIGISQRRAEALPMGTTIAALRIGGDAFEVAWVGDSRVYLWQGGALKQLSQDHSYVQELVAHGAISAEQARRHPQRNMVTQALGVTAPEHLHVETVHGKLEPRMQFLVCSDGLTEEVDDTAIATVLAREDLAAQECIEHLILSALDAGGSDNITAILVRVR